MWNVFMGTLQKNMFGKKNLFEISIVSISNFTVDTFSIFSAINYAFLHRDGEKIDFFDFLLIRLALSIIDKKLHLSIKYRFCLELQKSQ